MRLPYRPKTFTKFKYGAKYLIIHDVTCQFENLTDFYQDSPKFQTSRLRMNNFVINNQNDLNYHFICEKINDDYETLMGRPLSAMCDYDDIPSPYDRALHICVMGNLDQVKPTERMYKQIAYRAVAPLVWQYNIKFSRVMLHNEVSPESGCPGSLFDKNVFYSYLRGMIIPR